MRAAAPVPEQQGRVERSCCPELPSLGCAADAWCSVEGRAWLQSLRAACAPAVPPPRAEHPRLRELCGQPAPALPVPQPACSAGSPACLFLQRWLVPGGVTCVPWALESSHCSLPPSPLPSRLEQACAGLCLMPRELWLFLSQSFSAPAELARLSHIGCDGKAV